MVCVAADHDVGAAALRSQHALQNAAACVCPNSHRHQPWFTCLCSPGELNHSRLQVLLGSIADDELTTLEERAAVSGLAASWAWCNMGGGCIPLLPCAGAGVVVVLLMVQTGGGVLCWYR